MTLHVHLTSCKSKETKSRALVRWLNNGFPILDHNPLPSPYSRWIILELGYTHWIQLFQKSFGFFSFFLMGRKREKTHLLPTHACKEEMLESFKRCSHFPLFPVSPFLLHIWFAERQGQSHPSLPSKKYWYLSVVQREAAWARGKLWPQLCTPTSVCQQAPRGGH